MKDSPVRRYYDLLTYRMLLGLHRDRKENLYDCTGCGLEIEFGVDFEPRSRVYIRNGLRKLKRVVGKKGKFVIDNSIGHDLNVEIVLIPLEKEVLHRLFHGIKEIVSFYDNLIHDNQCGIHANFMADDALKRRFYKALISGGYDPARFSHSKYKIDFMQIVTKGKNGLMTYDEYIKYQKKVSGKYSAVNFLKPTLIEFRSMTFEWDDIAYVYDLFESVKNETFVSVPIDESFDKKFILS